MTPGIKPLVAGNWKMNGFRSELRELKLIGDGFDYELRSKIDVLICPPVTLLYTAAATALGSQVKIGAQDCHENSVGAHTGDISAEMIADCGATCLIVGHSERRTDHGESDAEVLAKAEAGLRNDLMTIVCIGETESQRKSGDTLSVLKAQLAGSLPDKVTRGELVIAYEPVWAIGTGMVPSASDVEEAHNFMRQELINRYGDTGNAIRLLYGGSVKPSNAEELMAISNVDGALVGGASLKSNDFLGICTAYKNIV